MKTHSEFARDAAVIRSTLALCIRTPGLRASKMGVGTNAIRVPEMAVGVTVVIGTLMTHY